MYKNPKQILLSKRANIFYIDRAKIIVDAGCVKILGNHTPDLTIFLNLPDRNTSLLLLGHGTSITNEAIRLLTGSCVMVGFCGTGGSPLHNVADMVFMPYNNEYRPTKYMQEWIKIWLDEDKRLELGKYLLKQRLEKTIQTWDRNIFLTEKNISIDDNVIDTFEKNITNSKNSTELLLSEARWAKTLYKLLAEKNDDKFVRKQQEIDYKSKTKTSKINMFLNHGNYLAYGCAAVALTGMGISYAFPILHGKTRRGALVFDIADLIKDAYVLPLAFEIGASRIKKESVFRAKLIEEFDDKKVLDYLFDMIKKCIENV